MNSARLTFIVIATALALSAQLTRSQFSGTLEDDTGAAIIGVRVTASNQATGIRWETETNEAGTYRLVAVEQGSYNIEYRRAGLETINLRDVTVAANQEVILNQVLRPAAELSELTVVASAAQVQLARASATLDRHVTQQVVDGLSVTPAGQIFSVWNFALLAPTAVRVSNAAAPRTISVNGQRSASLNFTLDGIDNNEFFSGIPANYPIREELSEVQVQTAAYSAEFGRNSSQLSLISRSGTNNWHGEIFDYHAANWLQAVTLQDKRAGLKSPRFVSNRAGLIIGGPIRTNRTFFFGHGSTYPRRFGLSARTATPIIIPTPRGFAALSSIPLGSGQTAQSRQLALDVIGFFPELYARAPSFQDVRPVNVNGIPIEVGTARITYPNPSNSWAASFRIDHQLTSQDTLTFRIAEAAAHEPNANVVFSNAGFGTRFISSSDFRSRSHGLSYTRLISSRLTNEMRVGYNSFRQDYLNRTEEPATVVTQFFALGPSERTPNKTGSSTLQLQNVLSWLSGRHGIKFGADIRVLKFTAELAEAERGLWRFANLADFLNGQPQQLQLLFGNPVYDGRMPVQYYFVQDDWRATPELTLTFGLRYESVPVPLGYLGASSPEVASAGVPLPVRSDRNDWGPRFGFAWSPSAKDGLVASLFGAGGSVVRGGFGIAYNPLFIHLQDVRNNYPRAQFLRVFAPDAIALYPRIPATPGTTAAFNPGVDFTNLPSDSQNPTTNFYSLSVQRGLGSNHILEIGYSGSRNYHLPSRTQTNQAILTTMQATQVIASGNPNAIPSVPQRRLHPEWGSRIVIEPAANAIYNAGFVRLDRTFSRGWLGGIAYTWSSNFSDNDGGDPQNYSDRKLDYARSVLDRPHRLVVNSLYQTPALIGRSRIVREIFGTWQISGLYEWQSGEPFNITTGVDSTGAGLATAFAARPDYNAAGRILLDPVTNDWRTFRTPADSTSIFVVPRNANGALLTNSMPAGGTLGRNAFRGPSFINCNLTAGKTFSLAESWRLELRGESTNVFNHRNFGPPVAVMNAVNFGSNISDPGVRTIQLLAKLRF